MRLMQERSSVNRFTRSYPLLGGGYNYHDLSVPGRIGSSEFLLHLQFYIHAAQTGTFSATFSIGDPDPTGPQKITLNGTR